MSDFDLASASATLKNLRELYAKLYLLNPPDMSAVEFADWNKQFPAVSNALMVLQNQTLRTINGAFAADAEKVAAAIERAEKKLHGIQDTATVLKVIGGALKSIAAIAVLA